MNSGTYYTELYRVGGLEAVVAQFPYQSGTAVPAERGSVRLFTPFAMAVDFPPSFASCVEGSRLTLVAKLDVWDMGHDAHRLTSMHEGIPFFLTGLSDGDGHSYTLVNAEFGRQFPVPWIVIDEASHVFRHNQPSWDSLHQVVELCAGFGGMHQGMAALGFSPVVAVDANDRMMKLYGDQCDAMQVIGDVTQLSTLIQLWPVSKGAATLAAGFACQPFSLLGDRRGGSDPRSSCLTGILAIAHYLQIQAIILECVQPAGGNDFVLGELKKFVDISGFHVSQCDLRLDDIWPARRNRAWWLITSPFIGKIPLFSWPKVSAVTKVRHLIPVIQPWDVRDQEDLTLNDAERHAFGVENDSFYRYLLNFETSAPVLCTHGVLRW